jgi:hypothetical protein
MRGFVLLSALVVGALAFVLIGLCLADQAPLMPHVEGSDGCCGPAQCSVLAISVFVLGLLIAITLLRLATTTPVRSVIRPPIAPPPKLIFLPSA